MQMFLLTYFTLLFLVYFNLVFIYVFNISSVNEKQVINDVCFSSNKEIDKLNINYRMNVINLS